MMTRQLLGLVLGVMLGLTACGPSSAPATDTPAPLVATLPPPTATVAPPTPAPVTVAPSATAAPTHAPAPTDTPAASAPEGTPIAPLVAGQPITITFIKMLDATSGWGVAQVLPNTDDHLVQTSDGGATWRDRTPPQPLDVAALMGQAAAVYFLDASHAWATYSDRTAGPLSIPPAVWRTSDGGATWALSAPLPLPDMADYYQVSDLKFVDANTGWAFMHLGVGMSHDYVALFTTTDGGATWARQLDPNADAGLPMSCGKTGFAFVNAQTGWVTGDCGGVVPGGPYFQQTTDGGKSWTFVNLPAPAEAPDLYDPQKFDYACGTSGLQFSTPADGAVLVRCMVLADSSTQGWLYTTSDAGQTWVSHALPGTYNTYPYYAPLLYFLDATHGWILNDGAAEGNTQLNATADGTQNWTLVKKLGWVGQLDFVDAQTGWAVAHAGDAVALVTTTDGGQTWKEIKPVTAP